MRSAQSSHALPSWLDSETRALIEDIIRVLAERPPDATDPSDVDLLAVLDSEDPHIALHQGDALFHSPGLAYSRHLDAPREVQVMFSSRTFQEWDPTFIANVMRDSYILYARGPLPAPFAA